MGYVYLCHFSKRLHRAKHYTGYADTAESLARRVVNHAHGRGAKIMQAVHRAGIPWHVAKVWEDVDKSFERWLKNKKGAQQYCPICKHERR